MKIISYTTNNLYCEPVKKFCLILILGLMSVLRMQATHLIGGNIYYTLESSTPNGLNTYRVYLELYRDCLPSNALFDAPIKRVGIYRTADNSLVDTISMYYKAPYPKLIPNTTSNPCVPPPSINTVCYEVALYEAVITLPPSTSGYYIQWGRCCRNGTIVNINDPGNTGITLVTYIAPSALKNNSPKFNQLSPTFLCINEAQEIDLSATDPDGDYLEYYLTDPFEGGAAQDPFPDPKPAPYSPVTWIPPYSKSSFIGNNAQVSLNPTTGKLTFTPQTIGQFVFAVEIDEYRGGVKIGEIRKDIQVNVINCPINFPPTISLIPNAQTIGDTLVFYAGETGCFNFNMKDVNGVGIPLDNLSVSVDGDLFGTGALQPPYATFELTGSQSNRAGKVCWTPACNQLGISSFTITVSDNNPCPGPNIVTKTYYCKIMQGAATSPDVRCVSVTGPNQITVSWRNPPAEKLTGFDSYILERNDGSSVWSVITTFTDSLQTSYVDNTAANTNIKRYSYRLSTAKVCPNYFVGAPGGTAKSILAFATQTGLVEAQVSWNPYPLFGLSSYEVFANNLSGEQVSVGNVMADTTFTFLGCSFEGNFQAKITDPLTGCTVMSGISPNVDLEPGTPTVIDICRVSVVDDDGGAEISWNPYLLDDFDRYLIYRAKNNSTNYQLVGEITDAGTTSFVDATAKADSFSYCYYIESRNKCGSVLISPKDCTVKLSSKANEYTISLKWNKYSGWTLPDVENIELWRSENGTPTELLSSMSPVQLNFVEEATRNDLPQYCYRLKSTRSTPDCGEVWSNETCISFPPKMYFPSAFSPNNDGTNDVFMPIGVFAKTYELVIYDRWGRLAFRSNSPTSGWDGNINGASAPEGVYTYRLKVTGFKDENIDRTGTVTLIR